MSHGRDKQAVQMPTVRLDFLASGLTFILIKTYSR